MRSAFRVFTSVSGPRAGHLSHPVRQRFSRHALRTLAPACGQAAALLLYMLGSMTLAIPNALPKLTTTDKTLAARDSGGGGHLARTDMHLGPSFRRTESPTLRYRRSPGGVTRGPAVRLRVRAQV